MNQSQYFMKHFGRGAISFRPFAKANQYFLLILCVGFMMSSFAQESAQVMYKQSFFPRKMLPEDQKQYAMMIPETIEATVDLRYHKHIASIEEKAEDTIGGVEISMGDGGKRFLDLDQKKKLTLYPKSGLIPANFAVKEALGEGESNIKHTGKTLELLGYSCKEVTFEIDMEGLTSEKILVTAYYTDKIPYGFSPMGYTGLPGLLLKLDCEFFSYEATAVQEELQNITFEIPEGYREITSEQLADIMDEATEDMGF